MFYQTKKTKAPKSPPHEEVTIRISSSGDAEEDEEDEHADDEGHEDHNESQPDPNPEPRRLRSKVRSYNMKGLHFIHLH